jgi:hypothetical protein
MPVFPPDHIKHQLLSILSDKYTHVEVNNIVSLCHTMATTSLKYSIIDGSKNQETIGLTRNDVAYDCIADLFQKDDAGKFVKLIAYFSSFNLEEISNQEIVVLFRRIVSSRVQQGLFHLYQETDPSLGKILRNIKLSIHQLNNYDQIDRFGETHIAPIHGEIAGHLPVIDLQTLTQQFSPYANGSESIPQLLAKLSLFLAEQNEYRRSVPLITVALAFRAIYGRELSADVSSACIIEENLDAGFAASIVAKSCETIKQKMKPVYLDRKKISEALFDIYFEVTQISVSYVLLNTNGEDTSLFGALKSKLPQLTPREYTQKHKNTLEYLTRLCKEEAIIHLREDISN